MKKSLRTFDLGILGGLRYVENACLFSFSCRQSKLSTEQLQDLQKSTHFDKKELQQWYKGESQVYNQDQYDILDLAEIL